ncbi:MAG: hypothetical protein K5985_12260 [Lachnospiraceae bacterium]|nr:hypothetical protein [Lachnospiraceae bacterium]
MAGVSLVMGIAGILTSFLAIGAIPSFLGIILSLGSKGKSRKKKAGLVTSLIGLVLSVLFIFIYVRAVKNPGADGIFSRLSKGSKGSGNIQGTEGYEIPEEFRAGEGSFYSLPEESGRGTLDPAEVFTEEMFDPSNMPHRDGSASLSDRDFDEVNPSPEIKPSDPGGEEGLYVCRVEAGEGLAPFLKSYYEKYFATADEVHAIINSSDDTTTRVYCDGGFLVAEVFPGAAGGAADVGRIFSGIPTESYRVFLDNGDVSAF